MNEREIFIAELGTSDPAFTSLFERVLRGDAGRATATDPWTGKQSIFLFAPIPSAEWTFVAVLEITPETSSP